MNRLPLRTNQTTFIKEKCAFVGITDNMEYKEKLTIVDKNNINFTKQQYERMGIKVISNYDHHDLLCEVELPDGWRIEQTSGYWKTVYDNKDRKRIEFFAKTAMYDRDAFCNFCTRYSYMQFPFDNYESKATYEERKFKQWSVFILDGGKRTINLAQYTPQSNYEYLHIMDSILKEAATEYLNSNYPDWKDINAYWD